MVRKVLAVCAIGGLTYVTARVVSAAWRDIRHYDRMRAMSGEGPLITEVPKMFAEIMGKERRIPMEFLSVAVGLPLDAARYLKIKAM